MMLSCLIISTVTFTPFNAHSFEVNTFEANSFKSEEFDSFNQAITSIEQASDSKQTAKTLDEIKVQLDNLTLKQQIIYYKLLAEFHIESTRYNLSLEAIETGLEKTKALSNPSILISELLYKRGFAKESLGDFDGALIDYKLGLETARSLNNDIHIAHGLVNIGAIYYLSDRYEYALKVLNDAYNIAKNTDDDELKGDVNSELGILYSYLGQNDRAMQYYEQAYLYYKQTKKMLWAHNSLINLATLNASNKNYLKAIDIYQTIIEETSSQNSALNHDLMFSVYTGMSWSYLRLSDDNALMAYQYMLEAKKHIDFIEQFDIKLQFYSEQAYVLFSLKKYEQALESISAFDKYFNQIKSAFSFQQQLHINLIKLKAEIYYQLKQYPSAYNESNVALSLTTSLKAQEQIRSITEVRLKLEAEQQDLENEVLENKERAQSIALKNTKNERTQEGYFLVFTSILALVFFWLVAKLIQGEKRLKKSLNTDALTNIDNKKSLLNRGQSHLKLALRKQLPFSILVFKINNLKELNNTSGYLVADELLQFIALVGQSLIRKSDVFGRWAGDEFMVILPASTLVSTNKIVERFKENILKNFSGELVYQNTKTTEVISIEISTGIASVNNEVIDEAKSGVNTQEDGNTLQEKSASFTGNDNDLLSLIAQAREAAVSAKADIIQLGANSALINASSCSSSNTNSNTQRAGE